ncbi:MAG: glycine oxidase ThiO [Pseudonocardiales bacterium]|nr:glycine oxidase ThiO [Pseudonocardiales bacterium]MBV9030251.1 glycine oxidase ThiO [Pseudonocardiales bacterium]
MRSSVTTVAVVGGGVIGLSCAWRAAAAGFAVTVYDPAPGSGASRVAGGMLAPVTEAVPVEPEVFALGEAALRRWPDFAAELASAGADPGLRTAGTLVVALDPGDRAELDRVAEQLSHMGRAVEALSGRQVRRVEPSLGPQVRRALSVPEDLSVDNRALLSALLVACRGAGARFHAHRCLTLPSADVVVVAAGVHSAALHPTLRRAIRPVKGEILRLRCRPATLPPPSRTVRAIVGGRHSYLVPRDSGRLVLGATQREVGFDTDVTAGAVRELLTDAERVLPAIAEYALEETGAGLRPGSPDNLPVIGALEPGVLAATGHHRNGILLAPLTAEAVLALLRGEPVPVEVAPATPARLPCGQPVSGDASHGSHRHSRVARSAP